MLENDEYLIDEVYVLFAFWVKAMINQTRQQIIKCLGMASQASKKGINEEDDPAIKKEIEANQDNALSLCTEKVLLARQAYDLVSLISLWPFLSLYTLE